MSSNAELADAFEAAAEKLIADVTSPPPEPTSFQQEVRLDMRPVHPSQDPNQVAKAHVKAEVLQTIADVYRGLA